MPRVCPWRRRVAVLTTVATLIGGFACVAVALEAPLVAFVAGGLAYWMLTLAVH
jgi:hypothetical protein